MASSRIFVKGLPPTFTETEFKKHFSSQREITDAKIFPNRRIGYVGYKTPEDAQKAVKYYNRTFIRMSKIGVEIARPIQDSKSFEQSRAAPTARSGSADQDGAREDKNLKRKRDAGDEAHEDPKLKEFLDVMKPKSKKKAWEAEGQAVYTETPRADDAKVPVEANESDEEYENVPKKAKRRKPANEAPDSRPSEVQEDSTQLPDHGKATDEVDEDVETAQANMAAVSDSDWARTRTSRLLGLLDDEEEEAAAAGAHQAKIAPSEDSDDDQEVEKGTSKARNAQQPESSIPTPPSDALEDKPVDQVEATDPDIEAVRSSMRLFIRNLPYGTKGEDLGAEFGSFGPIEEVRHSFRCLFIIVMNPDRDS